MRHGPTAQSAWTGTSTERLPELELFTLEKRRLKGSEEESDSMLLSGTN